MEGTDNTILLIIFELIVLILFFYKDEAYELGRQWARLYEPDSPTNKLITDFMESAFLVNVVHNDFKDPEAIFKPFFLAGEAYNARKKPTSDVTVNGVH